MEKPNWRIRDIAAYFGCASGAATLVGLEWYGPGIFVGFLALLQLTETVLHAFSDAVTDAKRDGEPR